MTILLSDYSSVITEGDEMFLHNESAENILKTRLERLESHYKGVRSLLEKTELPANGENIQRVAREGGDGLKAVILDQTEREIRRLCIPGFLANQFRNSATSEIPGDTWIEADDLASKIASDEEGLPIQADDFIFSDEIIKAGAVRKRIMDGCRIRITEGMKAEADKIKKLAKELRTLELTGLNAIELVSKYARAGDTPAPSLLFNDLAFRRHAPGCVADDLAFVFNESARMATEMMRNKNN